MKYEVFARVNPGDEITHVGQVDATSDRLARSYAHATFDEEDWDYMAVVRREHLVEVGAPEIPTTGREAGGGDP